MKPPAGVKQNYCGGFTFDTLCLSLSDLNSDQDLVIALLKQSFIDGAAVAQPIGLRHGVFSVQTPVWTNLLGPAPLRYRSARCGSPKCSLATHSGMDPAPRCTHMQQGYAPSASP